MAEAEAGFDGGGHSGHVVTPARLVTATSGKRIGAPFLAGRVAFSPSSNVAATLSSRPRSDHAVARRCHISTLRVGSTPLAINNRADVISSDANTHSFSPSSDAHHFRLLNAGVMTMRIVAACGQIVFGVATGSIWRPARSSPRGPLAVK